MVVQLECERRRAKAGRLVCEPSRLALVELALLAVSDRGEGREAARSCRLSEATRSVGSDRM